MLNLWTFLTIIVVAGIISEIMKSYFKSKASSEEMEQMIKERFKRYEAEMETLRKRVRNLEVIAATEPEEFQGMTSDQYDEFNIEDVEEFDEKLVNQLAKKKQKGR